MRYVLIKDNQIINIVEVEDMSFLEDKVASGSITTYDTFYDEEDNPKYYVTELPVALEAGQIIDDNPEG